MSAFQKFEDSEPRVRFVPVAGNNLLLVSSLPMGDPSPILAAQRLSRRVGDTTIVDGVDFEVVKGDIFVVFGPSGSGKSTLLRLLNRLEEPSSGTVFLDGTDYRTLSPRVVRHRIGLVPQQSTLKDGTVAENVAWGPRLRDAPVDRDRMEKLLDRLGLEGYQDRSADGLSGGEAQRVAIARALFNDPDIVLLDEPTSSLDAAAADRVESLLADVMAAYSVTTVLVTHDTEQARRLGTRGIRLEEGRVVRRGSVEDVIEE